VFVFLLNSLNTGIVYDYGGSVIIVGRLIRQRLLSRSRLIETSSAWC